MLRLVPIVLALLLSGAQAPPLAQSQATGQVGDQLWHHRNLGKAFYENPTTQTLAVDEFKRALDLAPGSARERLNYGLALMRAGKTADGMAEILRVQKQDPALPHTWFNLGIAYKRDSQYERAISQFEQMVKLAPDEAISHYNLGYLYKLTDKPAEAVREFEISAKLDPNLAAPRFQLFNAYRDLGRPDDAKREQDMFQEIKRRQAGAAIPEDLDWSFYSEILDPADPDLAADDTPGPALTFTATQLEGPLAAARAGVLTLDADGDGRADLLAWNAASVRLFKNGDTRVANAGLADVARVRSVAAGDIDNDGLPELCVLSDEGAALYVNKAGVFTRSAAPLATGSFAKAVWLDYDHDYDADLMLVGDQSRLLRNNGKAGFSDQTADFPFVSEPAVDALVFNLVNDTTGHDVVVSFAGRGGVIYRDLLAGKYRVDPLDAMPAGARSLLAQDVDHDGWLDLMAAAPAGAVVLLNREGRFEAAPAVTPAAGGGRVVALADFENRGVSDLVVDGAVRRNLGRGRFAGSGATLLAGATALAVADFNHDGREDAAALAADGSLHLVLNATATSNAWVRINLTGVRNSRLAPEAQVEVKSGPRYQKRTFTGTPLVFGLRGATQIDTVRITWPNGLIQNEVRQPVSRALAYKEAQRLSGSCPMIFTWDGEKFRYITDVLGVAPLGAMSGDGTFFPVDHDEYVQIPGDALALVDGAYEVRITEELREVAYLDQIQLIAVDHPKAVDVFTNDKFKAPPFPEFRLFGAERRLRPVRAVDAKGHDVRAKLLATDQTYPDTFTRNYSGVAELHTIDLDFGAVAADNRAVLILNGWVDWADGSTFLGVAQENPAGLIFPSVQVKDAAGRWVTVVEDMGIPAGKPKTIAVDLTGKFLSSSREVRIVTNLCLYWDEVFLSESSTPPAAVLTTVTVSSADLRYRGFSTPTIHPERKQPETFDYQRPMPLSNWNPTPGLYTKFGDVTPLLHSIDDRLVIIGSGDEIRLRFPAAGLPPLKDGWTRNFLLMVDGWAKDGDANTAHSQTVEPLPFHGMSAYPYPETEQFPSTALHLAYRELYNQRPALRLLQPLTSTRER